MASEVFTTEIVTLLDGTEVELRPLPIAKLRKFMRVWQEHIKEVSEKLTAEAEKDQTERTFADMTDAQFDAFIKMCALGLESELKTDGMTDKKYHEHLENVLDEATIYRVLHVTGNLKIGGEEGPNPNPQMTNLGAGTN